MKKLIISPQAGLGNRLRALSSAIVLANLTKREIYHGWIPFHPNDPRHFVKPLQQGGFNCLFSAWNTPGNISNLEQFDLNGDIDICYSEWLPGDYWFEFQSNIQKLYIEHILKEGKSNKIDFVKINDPSKEVLNSDKETILIETSHCLQSIEDKAEFDKKIKEVYRYLKPKFKYENVIHSQDPVDIGIAIRRGDLLYYASEAYQNKDDLKDWCLKLAKNHTVVVFSDDTELRHEFNVAIGQIQALKMDNLLDHYPAWESGFLQFLYLADKCSTIYGTPGSSFAYEASLFGDKPFMSTLA